MYSGGIVCKVSLYSFMDARGFEFQYLENILYEAHNQILAPCLSFVCR